MNKSNFLDIGKTFLIIIFFLIIIALIIIVTDPIKFNTMLFGNRVIEGMAPSVNQCHDCVIEPKNGDIITRFKDINLREFFILLPLLFFVIYMGIYPSFFSNFIHLSVCNLSLVTLF